MAQTIIEALREYFAACPLLEGGRLNIDYLPEDAKKCGVEYSIDTTPAEEIITRYVGGSAVCQYVFVIRSVNDYGPSALQNISNSGFFEKLSAWMAAQTKKRALPALPEGMEPQKLEAQGTGYLYGSGADAAKYQVQCRLVFYKKGERI